jgi:hypothetical protein
MNTRLAAIEVKRARLIERAAREREDLAFTLQSLSKPLRFIDRCVGAARFVISQPALLAGVALVLAVLHPRSAFRWARRAWAIWRGYRWLTRKAAI